jgi:hypothetical protein
MKAIDFTQPGGFPLTQDRLDYLQSAYTEVLKVLGSLGVAGASPTILSGMTITGGGNTVSDGWFVYGGELIRFTGSTVAPTGGDVALVLITAAASPLTFNDGSTPNVLLEKTAALATGPTLTDATHFPVSDLISFGSGFGINNREQVWNSLVVNTAPSAGGVTGTIFYKKDFTANTLQVRGLLSANNAQNFAASPAALYSLMGTLPPGYIPNNNAYFVGHYFVASLIKDDLGVAWIKQVTSAINNTGQIYINWLKPDPAILAYGLNFNAIIPLD